MSVPSNGKLELLLEQLKRGEAIDKLFMETLLTEMIKLRNNSVVTFGILLDRSIFFRAGVVSMILVILIVIILAILEKIQLSSAIAP